jgi:putative membrane protein
MQHPILATTLLASLALAVTAGPVVAQSTTTTGGPASLRPADLEFVLKAYGDGIAEIALGELAQQQAGRAEVRNFGQHMAEDHGKANQELAQIATSRGTNPPEEPPKVATEVQRTLEAYQGADFDSVYIAQQVGAHTVAVTLFEHEAENSQTPELRDFAQKYLSVLKEHLQQAKTLLQTVGQQG